MNELNTLACLKFRNYSSHSLSDTGMLLSHAMWGQIPETPP